MTNTGTKTTQANTSTDGDTNLMVFTRRLMFKSRIGFIRLLLIIKFFLFILYVCIYIRFGSSDSGYIYMIQLNVYYADPSTFYIGNSISFLASFIHEGLPTPTRAFCRCLRVFHFILYTVEWCSSRLSFEFCDCKAIAFPIVLQRAFFFPEKYATRLMSEEGLGGSRAESN